MLPPWVSVTASVGMAVGPPLVYADQAVSIVRKKDSTGFSRDVCAILLLANITRCFFWLGTRFEFALLVQSILMILAQLALLYICIRYQPRPDTRGQSSRPFAFWHWPSYVQYIEFLAGFILISAIAYLIFGRADVYISIIGFVALGMESMLPVPQLISNYKQKSLYGFRASTLIGWVGGDSFKTAYFFVQGSPLQFKVCALFQLSVDFIIVVQRLYYGNAPPQATLLEQEDLEEALALAEE
ncbi:hypothetical protein BKA82DRAFT_14751 [Pisolithus tinctorius]|uniref:PQ-loop repeat-containing protein 1 n=1 Tax=Pisolithus tinctorius Marx 270 TaxID=870435 RepID=A0A0C3PHA9_PISTI|nr:hypothetical protein BKA82DRAFT_14751 [Pisolithus tinctorius]KIO07821.1 hypothetical protein M404DRAFT_14751 [Pisolithus tinctorius Marx 270]